MGVTASGVTIGVTASGVTMGLPSPGIGLGLGGGGNGERWFVVAKDLAGNRLIVSQGEDRALLYTSRATIEACTWIAEEPPSPPGTPFRCQARLRHRQPLTDCEATLFPDGTALLCFDAPQRAVTPGQAAVLYAGEVCLGGGTVA